MKLILAQPATQRFQWELDVLLTNIRQFTDAEVVLLFTEKDFTVPIHFRKKWGCSVSSYTDKRDDGIYIPSVRPYLLWQYLQEDPAREQETYLYIDSDIIFREWLDCATLEPRSNTIYGSDCSGYIGYDYIAQCDKGPRIAQGMAEICGITVDQMKDVPGIGAHIVMKNPRAEFWKRCYYDSNRIFHYLEPINTNLQKWTAEMWAQQWGWVREGYKVKALKDLDFCRPTDDIAVWDTVKILHNAGVQDDTEMFFKGKYDKTAPFGEDFAYVRADRASKKYVEAIQSVVR